MQNVLMLLATDAIVQSACRMQTGSPGALRSTAHAMQIQNETNPATARRRFLLKPASVVKRIQAFLTV